MKLIEKLLRTKQERKLESALKYFYSRLKKGRYENMTMQEYFLKDYRANCYYYSTYFLLCLKPTDRLVRGKIHLDGDYDFVSRMLYHGKVVPNYEHGWIEFEFEGEWWVWDDHYNNPVPLEQWKKDRAPYEIYTKFTQTELIDYMLSKHKDEITISSSNNVTKISTQDVWDSTYNIPLPYVDLVIKNGEIKKVDVDIENKEVKC